ncbi:hypothetical protein HYT92_00605 [Candidatus Pacearchaeota archaeon]|nr:hypothetical protein [Candidatus Pacearchaeota archaeon]
MINKHGLWWRYSDSNYSFLISNRKDDGFSREDAENIAPQLKEAAIKSMNFGNCQYVQVSLGEERFYVIIKKTMCHHISKIYDF